MLMPDNWQHWRKKPNEGSGDARIHYYIKDVCRLSNPVLSLHFFVMTLLPACYQQTGIPWIGIAFRYASPRSTRDRVVSALTSGPYVHTEVLLADGKGGLRAYSACDNTSGFSPSSSFDGRKPNRWTAVRYTFKSDEAFMKAYAFLLHIISLSLPYNKGDLWQCFIQAALPFEADLDCDAPRTWTRTGVFCSQVALLILRKLRRDELISFAGCDETVRHLVEHTNSRGCSPNQLFKMLVVQHPPIMTQRKKNCMKGCGG